MPNWPKRSFCFAPMHNAEGSHDATGAFHVGMHVYKKVHEALGGTVVTHKFDNSAGNGARSRAKILDMMRSQSNGQWWDAVVYFGHGTENFLASAGWSRKSVKDLTDLIDEIGAPGVKVLLYACSCSKTAGIAWNISEYLKIWANYGMEVYGHISVGHTFANPQVTAFPSANGQVGRTVAPFGMETKWNKAIRDQKNTLWCKFPFMTAEEIEAAL